MLRNSPRRRCAPPLCLLAILISPAPLAHGAVVLNELMASNRATLLDDAGRPSDWVELHNTGGEAVSLEGYGLSDDPDNAGKWRFPPGSTLAPGAYVIVWCSGNAALPDPPTDPNSETTPPLHASFQLSSSGETVLLTAADDTLVDVVSFEEQIEDQSFGRSPDGVGEFRYHVEPTPGTANGGPTGSQPLVVADTRFSVDRGFFEAPFDLEIRTETPGAQIHYTTDGSTPTTDSPPLDGAVRIQSTTVVRARAFLAGYRPTNTDTQTYVFIDSPEGGILRQPSQPRGFPELWGERTPDYAMDSRVATQEDSPVFEPEVRQALLDLPSLSLVLSMDDLFDPEQGIYSNPGQSGVEWERPASLELIFPDDRRGLQIDAGLRIQGGASRSLNRPKHNLRLLFKSIYGPSKLRFPLFKDSPVAQFDTIILRGGNGDSWFHPSRNQQEDAQYIRDQWARDIQQGMGRLTTHQAYMHLYLNGLYWGVYHVFERPSAPFLADHLGGSKEEYDALNLGEPVDGNLEAWDEMMALSREVSETPETYASVLEYLDAPNLIDFLLINFYNGNTDWDHNNWYAGRRRAPGAGYKFFVWDSERTFLSLRENTVVRSNNNRPTGLHNGLRFHEEYRILFADHVQRHFFDEGLLTPARAAQTWLARAEEIERPLRAESARWGDNKRAGRPYTVDREWREHLRELRDEYFPERTAIVLDQLRARELFPALEAPLLGDHGGRVPRGHSVSIDAIGGEVFVTTDGSDPRLPGGNPSKSAERFIPRQNDLLLTAGAPVRILIPSDGSLGDRWLAPDFDDSAWLSGATGVGYQRALAVTGFFENIEFPIEELLYQVSTTVYLRLEFDVASPELYDLLELHLLYDDGFVAYLNGERVASRLAPEELAWDSSAASRRSNLDAVQFERIELGSASLRQGRNVLAFHGLNFVANDRDFLLLPELRGIQLADTAIPITESVLLKARARLRDEWSPLREAVFLVEPYPLRFTEIHYHPPAPVDESPFGADDFEFVELRNVGTESVALDGLRVGGGIEGALPAGLLAPGEALVLSRNETALRSRYQLPEGVAVVSYEGQLRNSGESIQLLDPDGQEILSVTYDDAWYPATDGFAFSLVLQNENDLPARLSSAQSWGPSRLPGGSPGTGERPPTTEGLRLPADANEDGRLNIEDAIVILRGLFDSRQNLPCAGDTVDDRGTLLVLDVDGDGRWSTLDGLTLLQYLFAGGPPPALGTNCTEVRGCKENCSN